MATLSKSTRDYVKHFGRVAHSKNTFQNLDVENEDGVHMGVVHVFYHPADHDYVWRGQVTHRGRVFSHDCKTYNSAVTWVATKFEFVVNQITFGVWLEGMLVKHNISHTQLSKPVDEGGIGVSRMTVHQWVNDKRKLEIGNLEKLVRFLTDLHNASIDAEIENIMNDSHGETVIQLLERKKTMGEMYEFIIPLIGITHGVM